MDTDPGILDALRAGRVKATSTFKIGICGSCTSTWRKEVRPHLMFAALDGVDIHFFCALSRDKISSGRTKHSWTHAKPKLDKKLRRTAGRPMTKRLLHDTMFTVLTASAEDQLNPRQSTSLIGRAVAYLLCASALLCIGILVRPWLEKRILGIGGASQLAPVLEEIGRHLGPTGVLSWWMDKLWASLWQWVLGKDGITAEKSGTPIAWKKKEEDGVALLKTTSRLVVPPTDPDVAARRRKMAKHYRDAKANDKMCPRAEDGGTTGTSATDMKGVD